MRILLMFAILLCCVAVYADDQMMQCPMHKQHASDHFSGVNERGDQAMGFDHTKTTHHFFLRDDGGVIQVTANNEKDTGSRDQIRMHLQHIAAMFSDGNFQIPMFIHDQVPPGVETMKRHKENIAYHYQEIANGGEVQIHTQDADSISAIHDFLRFQIQDHQTGDSMN